MAETASGLQTGLSRARARLAALVSNRAGATAIEYALIAAGISIAATGGMILIGPEIDTMFQRVAAALISLG